MVRLLDQQVRVRKETAPILVQAMSGCKAALPEHFEISLRKRVFSPFSAVSAHGTVLALYRVEG
jgi:hypothetical protein